MNQASIATAAVALRAARAQRQAIAPVSATYGIEGLEAAYAVSDLNIQADLAAGHAAVVQIVSTGEALMERRLSDIPTDEWNDIRVDITPREYVLSRVPDNT